MRTRKPEMKLQARKEDLEHAVKDALYTQRLVDHGHSPFKLFLELNTIALNIKKSSETANQPDRTEAQ
jgi:hypothetical protein